MIVGQDTSLVNRVSRPTLLRGDSRAHFLHVQKCGGTTTRYILEAACQVLGVGVENQAGAFLDAAAKANRSDPHFILSHDPPPDLFDRTDTHYFTLLRDPITRIGSLISHNARSSRGLGLSHDEIFESMTEWEFNQATCLIGWAPGSNDLDDMLDRAKSRLRDGVLFFGLQEKYQEFGSLLATFLGFEGLIFSRYQVRDTECRLSPKNLERLPEKIHHDAILYAHARDLYEEKFAPLFPDATFRKPRPGVEYLAVRYDADTHTVAVDKLVFG
jgi:hypothetical protein